MINKGQIKWVRTMRPSPLIRGLCKSCQQPVMGYLYGAISIIPANSTEDIDLPPVACDIYYRTRQADLQDDVPKYESALATYAGLTLPFLGVLFSPIQRSQ